MPRLNNCKGVAIDAFETKWSNKYMIETKRSKPRKKNIVVIDFIKALSEKSANEFTRDIETDELYNDLKPKKINKVIDL